MDQQQIKGLADRFIHQLHRLEQHEADSVDGLVEMFDDQAQLTNPMIEHRDAQAALSGREQIEQFWREYSESFQNIQSEFIDVTTGERSAGLFWQSKGTDKQGRPVEYEGVSLLEVNDEGRITRFKGYFDSRKLS